MFVDHIKPGGTWGSNLHFVKEVADNNQEKMDLHVDQDLQAHFSILSSALSINFVLVHVSNGSIFSKN